MRLFFYLSLIILAGCTGIAKSPVLAEKEKISNSQIYLVQLKDSLKTEFGVAKSEQDRQALLDRYHQRLEEYLAHNAMDSIKVTIDEVSVDGRTVKTKSHLGDIQFEYTLKFAGTLSPRIDSIYEFVKGLKEKSDTLVNLSYTGACQVNSPDSINLPTFRIYAFPVLLQYPGK